MIYNIYNRVSSKEVQEGRTEARGNVAAVKLTTRIADSQKVEFPKNLFGLPFQACPDGQQKIGRPKARKEVGLSGNV